MKAMLTALALLGMAVPSGAQTVRSAEGDWSDMPEIRFDHSISMSMSMEVPEAIQRLVQKGKCSVSGVTKRRVDMDVPFLIRFSPTNAVDEVVVRKLGCERAEAILGAAIIKLAKAGALKPTGQNVTGWYRSSLSFEMNRFGALAPRKGAAAV
ncbi:MAG TPA: hypothetical protein VGC35_14075 [Allosphingosinicella sp.]|jgi:hypothetical protein